MNVELPSDEQKFEKFYGDVSTTENLNVGAYDKAVLTLASAALALSLAFTKDIVPVESAKYVVLLYFGWAGFVLTLMVSISNYILALGFMKRQRELAIAVWRKHTESEETLIGEQSRHGKWQYRLNVSQGLIFLLSMVLCATYIGINVGRETHMHKGDNQSTPAQVELLKKSFSSPAYVPMSAPNPLVPPAPAATPTQPAQSQTPAPTAMSQGKPKT